MRSVRSEKGVPTGKEVDTSPELRRHGSDESRRLALYDQPQSAAKEVSKELGTLLPRKISCSGIGEVRG